jgi:cytochrome c1
MTVVQGAKKRVEKFAKTALGISILCVLTAGPSNAASEKNDDGKIDPISGFVIKPGFEMVRAHCTACHSGKLVTQNHMSRERWLSTIRWMQKTQNLWPLPQEEQILDYLSTNYGEKTIGRRAPLPPNLMPKS